MDNTHHTLTASRNVASTGRLRFRDRESYYATLADELTHWTRHQSRLGRGFGRKRFGDEGYAMEELVAELNAALSADLGLTPAPPRGTRGYIAY